MSEIEHGDIKLPLKSCHHCLTFKNPDVCVCGHKTSYTRVTPLHCHIIGNPYACGHNQQTYLYVGIKLPLDGWHQV